MEYMYINPNEEALCRKRALPEALRV